MPTPIIMMLTLLLSLILPLMPLMLSMMLIIIIPLMSFMVPIGLMLLSLGHYEMPI